ncbi:MAG: fibronectin type III domain-containing protein [Prevotella sp.]
MAQPDALPDGAGTLKAEGDNLKAVYTQTEGWVINAGKQAVEINLTSGGKVLQCGIDGDLKTIYHGETIDVSKMTNLHLDIYPTKVNENGVLGIFVYSNGVPADWRGIEISGITANKWNSIDIDLSKYPSNPLSPITALAISGGVSVKNENNAGSGFKPHPNETEIYVANAYFYAYADDSKPTLTTSVKNTTSNSITFLAKAVKAKETVGEEITYTVTYNGNNKTFIARSGVETDLIIDGLESETEYKFTIKATDANGISSKEQSQTVKTLKETALQPTSIPDLKTGYGEITELYTKGENKNGYNWYSWGGSKNSGKDIEIGSGKAFLIENFTYYGSQFTKVDGTGMTLHVDVYPLQDIDLGIIPITNDGVSNVDGYGQTFKSLKRGEWHELELTLNDFKDNLSLTDLYQIKYVKQASIDGTGGVVNAGGDNSFYIGNVYLYNEAADDGEDPVITYADTNTTTVASASFRLRATDKTEELSYKVVVKDKNGNTISNETVKGKPETDIYVGAKGLLPNTEYTATVTVSDNTRTSDPKVLNFTTHQLVSADKKSASSYYYENDKATLRGMLNSSTTGVDIAIPEENQISINADDKVLMFQVEKDKVFGLNIPANKEFGKAEKDRIVGIAVYPVGTTTIQVSPRIYGVQDKFENRPVKENEWNYITMKPLKDHDGDQAFVGVALKSAEKGTVFLDNFYMYTSKDVTAPTVTLDDIKDDDVHVNSVKVSFSSADEPNEEVKFGVWVKNITDKEVEYCGGFARAKNNEKVTYYLKGLKTGKEYEIYVKVRDFSENEGKSEVKRFKTKSYTDNISIESRTTNADNGGIVVLKGKWNVDEFNKIAAEYPYGCFDVRNVVFDDGLRHDRGPSGIQLFNHNAYFITDIGNNFDGNYAIPDEEGKLIGMNFQWYDGDFKPDGGPTDYVNYQKIIADYKEKHGTDYPGLSGSGYIKMDPYTGYDLYFKEQGASITRQMFMKTLVVGGTQGANKYSTMICPFAMNTDKVENCEFFQLNEPSVSGENVTLNFTQVTGKTEANKPYLIRVKGDGTRGGTAYFVDNAGDTEKKLSFSDIKNKEEIYGKAATDNNVKATLFGTYVTKTFTPATATKTSEVYGLKQDNDKLTLISSTKRSTLPAFRAAVKIEELPAKAKNIILSFDGETTGITSINNDEMTSILGNVYSIDGKKVASSRDALVTLPAGIYIVNGKKVVIK